MPLSTQDTDKIKTWSASDIRDAVATWQGAQQTPGTPRMVSRATLFEARVLGVLGNLLPAALAATPLIDPAFQGVADDLAALYGNTEMHGLTAATAPAVASWWLGDVMLSLSKDSLPAVIVSQTLPNGVDVQPGSIGYVDDNTLSLYVFYVLPYKATARRQMEAVRGAEVIADVLRSSKEDRTVFWQNGKVVAVQRNLARPSPQGDPDFVVGMVGFSVFQRVTYAQS